MSILEERLLDRIEGSRFFLEFDLDPQHGEPLACHFGVQAVHPIDVLLLVTGLISFNAGQKQSIQVSNAFAKKPGVVSRSGPAGRGDPINWCRI